MHSGAKAYHDLKTFLISRIFAKKPGDLIPITNHKAHGTGKGQGRTNDLQYKSCGFHIHTSLEFLHTEPVTIALLISKPPVQGSCAKVI